jgi:hypothetical protein
MRLSVRSLFATAFVAAMFCGRATQAQPVAITAAFTYQGELASSGSPTSGTYDIRFRPYDAARGGSQVGSVLCSDNLNISGGRFAVSLDFGAAFASEQRFLEIEVCQDTGLDCSDESGYVLLTPRRELTATPNATFAQTATTATTALTAGKSTSLNHH